MFTTAIIIIIYFIIVSIGAAQTYRLKNFLVQSSAISPDTAIFVDRQKYLVLTIRFPFSAIQDNEDGSLWVDMSRWRSMVIYFSIIFIVSLLSLLILLISYF